MDKIMDEIPCSEVEADESRFIKIIKEAIKTKEVKSYRAFTHGKTIFLFFFLNFVIFYFQNQKLQNKLEKKTLLKRPQKPKN